MEIPVTVEVLFPSPADVAAIAGPKFGHKLTITHFEQLERSVRGNRIGGYDGVVEQFLAAYIDDRTGMGTAPPSV